MLERLYTTKMSANKKQIQNRFTKIRSSSGRISKMMSFIMAIFVAVTMLCATVVMAALNNEEETSTVYEVYNGQEKIELTHTPFIYNDEYYLPLRQVLNGFGIDNIDYYNGEISIYLPKSEYSNRPTICKIKINGDRMSFVDWNFNIAMSDPPILREGTTYVTVDFFENLMRVGIAEDFRLNIIKPDEPERYYSSNEEVFIGTADEQDQYTARNKDKIIKRILVDDYGKVLAVIPVENQMAKNINDALKGRDSALFANSYTNLFDCKVSFKTFSGEEIEKRAYTIIVNDNDEYIAIIPAINIVNRLETNVNKGIRSTITTNK